MVYSTHSLNASDGQLLGWITKHGKTIIHEGSHSAESDLEQERMGCCVLHRALGKYLIEDEAKDRLV